MTATLVVTVSRPGERQSAAYAAMVRVRPARGRPVDRCVPLGGADELELAAGPATVEALLPTGEVLARSVTLVEGERLELELELPAAPDASTRWLSLARTPTGQVEARGARLPSRVERTGRAPPLAGAVEAHFVRAPGLPATSVEVLRDLEEGDGRVLHVVDARPVEVFGALDGSALALLELRTLWYPDLARFAAIPGPWHGGEAEREVHIALRPIENDALPDVQIVPANQNLATVVGFLERRDQRALALLREHFIARAVHYMDFKGRSPVAAALGLAVLLRLGDLDRAGGWSVNLWRGFPALPDGGALHTAVMLLAPADTPEWHAEFRAAALGAARSGLPLLTDSLRHLHTALAILGDMDADDVEAAAAARWCERLLRVADNDAVFTTVTLAARDEDLVRGFGRDAANDRRGDAKPEQRADGPVAGHADIGVDLPYLPGTEQSTTQSAPFVQAMPPYMQSAPPPFVQAMPVYPATNDGYVQSAPPTASAEDMRASTGAEADAPELVWFGVDARTGARTSDRVADVAAALREAQGPADDEQLRLGKIVSSESFGLPPGVDDQSLGDVGWGVIWGPAVTAEIKAALAPLLAHRRAEVADADLVREFDCKPGESARTFLQRHRADFGSVQPELVPYYLLIVGGPADVSFAFQALLDVEYRVGRLDLADAAAYARYAAAVVAAEGAAAPARDRVLHAFGPTHLGDAATAMSADLLVRAASGWVERDDAKFAKKYGLTANIDVGEDATRARLIELLRGTDGRPELLLTAGHGLLQSAGDGQQTATQGALITADWDGLSPIDAASRFAGADVPDDADVAGMVAFLFACFGAGTPATDSFPRRAGQALAPAPFVAALPRALLSHPRGAALGVFGHVDRTLAWSLQPPGAAAHTTPFARAAIRVLIGDRLGAALDDLNQRGASLAATFAAALRPGAPPIEDAELVRLWTQQRDAAAFILLGDPAARLRR